MKFPIKRSDLYDELAGLGYNESIRIDSPNQVLLSENKGIARNTITLKGSGISIMPGLTNQNPSIVTKSPTELVTYNITYPKTSALALDAGLIDDAKLDAYITASGIDASLFIDRSLYIIEVNVAGEISIKFNDIFDDGLIMLPLVDGSAYQLDQLDKLGAVTDPVIKFATGKTFTKASVLANRKLVPGKTNTYFIPLLLKVTSTGVFPNFTVSAVEPGNTLPNYLAIGPTEINSSNVTVGWMGVNAITDTQFRPSAVSPLKVNLAIRQFKVSTLALSYASVAIIDALKATLSVPTRVIGYNNYVLSIVNTTEESRSVNIAYNEDYDKTKTHVLQVYTITMDTIVALNTSSASNDLNVLNVNGVLYKASQVLARIIEQGGKFYIGFELPISETPSTTNFIFNAGGLDNPNTDWTVTSWATATTQVIPKDLVVPVTQLANKFVKALADIDGGFKSNVKHMRVEFDVPANQDFAYGFTDTSQLTIVDESAPDTFAVVKPTSTVTIRDQTLAIGTVIRNTTNAVAKLRLYIQVPMASVNQSIGSNYLDESAVTLGAVFNPVTSKIKANGNYMFLGLQGTNDTVDVTGYSHRYQRLITADQAIKFKYNSVMAQSVSFGTVTPLDHTDVTQFQSSVVSATQTKVLITSDGYVYKVDETGFNQVDRIDIREGVYIEAAIDDLGTGLVITQFQYAGDNLTIEPTTLRVDELPGILGTVNASYTVHVSAVNLAKDTEVYLTDIYDIDYIIPSDGAISFAGVLELNGLNTTRLRNLEKAKHTISDENDLVDTLRTIGLDVVELTDYIAE